MDVKTVLQPGENGTKQLLKQYGDQLICVRYRYDKARQKRLKTVELIIDEKDWVPGVRLPAEKLVSVRVDYGEIELRDRMKKAGAFWDANKKVWRVKYQAVLELGMERRIVDEELGF